MLYGNLKEKKFKKDLNDYHDEICNSDSSSSTEDKFINNFPFLIKEEPECIVNNLLEYNVISNNRSDEYKYKMNSYEEIRRKQGAGRKIRCIDVEYNLIETIFNMIDNTSMIKRKYSK